MKEQLAYFNLTFEGEFYFSKLHKYLYATDASVYRKLPLAVAFPKNNNDLKQLINFATKHHTSLIPRTAGTSLAGQCVGDGIIVDVSKYFTKIISVDKQNKTITLQPGVIRDELNNYLKPFGLFFGPNTSTSNRCMIGGMVGNNSSGTTSIQYGVTRDKVLELKTILSNGEEVTFKSLNKETFEKKKKLNSLEGTIYKTIYNELKSEKAQLEIINNFPKSEIHRRNTGYAIDELIKTQIFSDSEKPINLASLLCGSEGTLAFTTEITLQLDNLPPQHTAMVVSHYSSLESCLNDVSTVMSHNLHTCEMMDDIILDCTKKNVIYNEYRKFVEGIPKALLLLELKADNKNDLETQVDELLISLKSSKLSYAYPALKEDEINNALELRKAGLGLLGNMVGDHKAVACIEDTAVALIDLPNYISDFTALMKKFNQKAVYYAHAGAGELHLRPILNLKEKEGVNYFREITTEVAKLVKKYRGSFSGEHGDGIVRGEFLPLMIGSINYEVLKRIKNAFDPNNIFNPGKIIDAFPMDKSLRYKEERNEPVIDTLIDFKDSEGILRMAEKCNGSGDCRKTENSNGVMCPSYQATKNELHTTRGRANVLREVLTNNDSVNKFDSQELKEAFNLCLSCKACGSECPSNVDIATVKAEFLYQYYKSNKRKFSDILFGKSSYYNSIAAKFPRLSNAVFTNKITAAIIKNISSIAAKRSLPIISSKPFNKVTQDSVYQNDIFIKEVVLFVDEFSNFFDAPIARDAYYLLKKLNYKVIIIDHLDSARALLSKGFLKEAQSIINNNIAYLNENISATIPIIGIEPSAILGFRDEYIRLAEDNKTASKISKQCFIIEEFIASEITLGNIKSSQFTSDKKYIKIHNHCHQKALSNQKVTFDILNLPLNYKPTIITSGCCGMAGSFGFEKDKYEVSMQIGELKLFPAIRNSPNDMIIAANGTSCRHQIKDGTQREAFHPISILRNALS
jgi:FAD/FMN-containing dehydrogenase/Fe-S oxidoreductase